MADGWMWEPPKPRELPVLREALADQMRSPHEHQALVSLLSMGRGTISPHSGDFDHDASVLLAEERRRLSGAQLYFVTEDMARLAHAAAESLPVGSSHPDDMPSEAGFLVFAEPLAVYDPDPVPGMASHDKVSVVAVSWGPSGLVPREKGMWLTFWSATDFDAEARELQRHSADSYSEAMRRMRQIRGELAWDNEVVLAHQAVGFGVLSNSRPGQPEHLEELEQGRGWDQIRDTTAAWAHVVRAAWLLMTQDGVTEVAEEHASRSVRRRTERAGHNSAPVRVVRIRHRENAPVRQPEDDGGRTYHVRWTVRGHWRKQWYPSRQEHRPVWINPHVKGPQGAPLHTSETVHLLDRA